MDGVEEGLLVGVTDGDGVLDADGVCVDVGVTDFVGDSEGV